MKNLILILCLMGMIFGNDLLNCKLRIAPNKNADLIKVIYTTNYIIDDWYADYYKIKILSGDNIGKVGVTYQKLLDLDNLKVISGKGICLRIDTKKDSEIVCTVKGDTKFEIIVMYTNWIHLQVEGTNGWVSK